MTDTCNAETGDGSPCQNRAGENGRCWIPSHNPGEDDENPHGRPSKLTKQIADDITSHIAEGKSIVSSSRMEGIPPQTLYSWLEKGEDAPADADFDAHPYGYFRDRYVRARGLGEDAYVQDALDIARNEGDLSTLLSMLKQRYPESWGDVDRGEQSGGVVVNVDAQETTEIDPETLEVQEN